MRGLCQLMLATICLVSGLVMVAVPVSSQGRLDRIKDKIEKKIEERFAGYEYLGSRKVDYAVDHDVIDVGAKDGRFTAILIEVEDGNLEMHGIKVTFHNDETFEPDTRLTFKEDTRSRTIDLPGEARIIRKVAFKYDSKGLKGKATINLFAKPAGGNTPTVKEPKDRHPGWEFLGSRQVKYELDHDVIDVGAKDGRFTAILIEVEEGNLEMHTIKLTFHNDETWSPDTRLTFKEDTHSRQIDLPGEARIIRKVAFKYDSKGLKGKATVNLYGKAASGPATVKEPKDRHAGWTFLGTRKVDFAKDKDTISVGKDEGSFTQIMIEVEDGELSLFDLEITFGNGDKHEPKTRLEFKDDTRTRNIDLPGKARYIHKVEFSYRSTKLREGRATVNLYAKK